MENYDILDGRRYGKRSGHSAISVLTQRTGNAVPQHDAALTIIFFGLNRSAVYVAHASVDSSS